MTVLCCAIRDIESISVFPQDVLPPSTTMAGRSQWLITAITYKNTRRDSTPRRYTLLGDRARLPI